MRLFLFLPPMDHILTYDGLRSDITYGRVATERFERVLARHALIMVDAATPVVPADKMFYVKLGTRLAASQEEWADLFCGQKDFPDDLKYKAVVKGAIASFTDRLMSMIVDGKEIVPKEIAQMISELHLYGAQSQGQWYLKETRQLFEFYVLSMVEMYRSKRQSEYENNALQCMIFARHLGQWLNKIM